jgi:hypothetical protein
MVGNIGGPLCAHCGWQEVAHELKNVSGRESLKKGYKYSLYECPGFEAQHRRIWHELVALLPPWFFKK